MIGLSARPYTIEEHTRTVCPQCSREGRLRGDDPSSFVDGLLVSHDGAVWMRRWCPVHGESESLYEEDAALWRARDGWSTPTLQVTADRPGLAGFPTGYAEGLPASHSQHTCILLLNVTHQCNYACPTCYATADDPGTPFDGRPTLDELLLTARTMIERENGRLGVLMLSGGEPTVRKDVGPMLEALAELPITRVMLNTNGRRVARDDGLLGTLAKLKDRVEVYLQFDGFRPRTHVALRGEDVADEKRRAFERLTGAGVYTTLVMTAVKGVNDDEIGEVARMGMATPRCAGLAIQPAFGSGRHAGYDPRDRLTPTGVLRRLAAQTDGLIVADDLVPLPCSHRDCCDIGYFVRTPSGEWRSLVKMLGRERLREWIGLVANTISFESASDAVKELLRSGALQRVFSEQQRSSSLKLAADVFSLCGCVPGLSELLAARAAPNLERLAERTFRLTVKMFMDAHTFHEARIRQCCVHVGTFEDDPRRYSFCWRWLFPDADDFPARSAVSSLRVVP